MPPRIRREGFGVDKAGVELGADAGLAHRIGTDEDDFLSPVTKDRVEIGLHHVEKLFFTRPLLLGHGGPPETHLAGADQCARLTDLADITWPCRQPEKALGAHHPRPGAIDKALEQHGIERFFGAVNEGTDAIFLGFGNVVLKAVQFLEPQGMFFGPGEIEPAGAEHLLQFHPAEIGLYEFRIRVQPDDDLAGRIPLLWRRSADLVEDDHIGKFDLLDQKVDDGAVVAITRRFAPVGQKIGRTVVIEKIGGIHHRHHRIQLRDIRQAAAVLVTEIEGGGHGKRLGDAGGFNQQIIEATLFGERTDLGQEVVAQRATDAAIGHFHQLFLGAGKIGAAIPHQRRIDIDFAHIVDDQRHAQAIAIGEDVVEKGGLASA